METFLYQRIEKKEPKINVWFAYPAIESFALASLGYLSIFKMMDLDPDLYVERVYSDSKILEIPYDCVDCMGFSCSFEIDILTVIKMLKKYGFPLKSNERDDDSPIIFAGGPVLMSNPYPYEEFFDFISVGEKACLKDAMEILKKKNELSRDELLKKLSEVDGIYVPKYKKDKINVARDDLEKEIFYTPILSDKSYFQDSFVIEIERGCPKMCNFCLASWLNLPTRFVPYEKIISAIDLGLTHTNKLALMGAYVAGHPNFNEIIKYISKKCEEREIELSISSLRADLADEELVETLVKCGQKTATIALEAGGQRLRNYVKKDLLDEQVLKTIETAQKGGLRGLKIYTMIGLPTENEDDIEALIELVKKIKSQIKKQGSAFDITISTSTFIPKIHTPFEFAIRCDKKILEKRINYLKKSFHKLGVNFRPSSVDWDVVQTILSRFPHSLADLLIEVVERGGNLGAFKQVWKSFYKEKKLMSFEQATNLPFDKENYAWNRFCNGGLKLKQKRGLELD